MKTVKEFIYDESAQSTAEYAILITLITAASYGLIELFKAAWVSKFESVKDVRTGEKGMVP